ncbi:MAG: hypothetical protein JNN05_02230 [Candidatus Omnitrophica bacterium]|nr:hypothetical protein [Candidatus Omnitrophota bacterium]
MPKNHLPNLKHLPLFAVLLFSAAALGLKDGRQAQAYLAYCKHNYRDAFELYNRAGDDSGRGLVSLAQNDPDTAMEYFQKTQDQSGMGLARLKRREYDQAKDCFIKGRDGRGLGLTHLAMHDYAQASSAFAKANDWSGMGLLELQKKNYRAADGAFQKVGDLSGRGLCALKEKKFKEAQQFFKQGNDLNGLGIAALAKRDFGNATDYFKQANDLSGLGQVALAQGDFKLAKYYYEQAYDYNGLGDLYSQLHQFAMAREMFARDYNPVKVVQSYRNDYSIPNKNQKAIAYAQKAISDGRMVPEVIMEMADIYYDMKEYQKGLEVLAEIKKYPGYAAEMHLRRGRIFFYLRDLPNAKKEFELVKADVTAEDYRVEEAQGALATISGYEKIPTQQFQTLKPADTF